MRPRRSRNWVVHQAACGACAGYGYRFGPNLNIISSIARNFKGRMGDPASNVYLGSPYTVAAAAVRGTLIWLSLSTEGELVLPTAR
jgi:homoaconitase/3-isopropylmalate dehydratase large subunit